MVTAAKPASYILKSNGTEVPYPPADGKHFTLAEMQKAVGGYIEHHLLPDGKNWIVINEEGVLDKLPPNDQATVLAYNLSPRNPRGCAHLPARHDPMKTDMNQKEFSTQESTARERRLARREFERRQDAEAEHSARLTGIAGAGLKAPVEGAPTILQVRDASFEKEVQPAPAVPEFLYYWGGRNLELVGLNICEATIGTDRNFVVMSDKPYAAAEMARVFDKYQLGGWECSCVQTKNLEAAFREQPSTVPGAHEFHCFSDLIETRLKLVFHLTNFGIPG